MTNNVRAYRDCLSVRLVHIRRKARGIADAEISRHRVGGIGHHRRHGGRMNDGGAVGGAAALTINPRPSVKFFFVWLILDYK